MNAKEFLSRVRVLNQRVDSKLEQVENLRSLAQSASISYGGEVVSHSRNTTSLQDTVIRLMKTVQELDRAINQMLDAREEVVAIINQVRNAEYQLILEKRYLCFNSWGKISNDLDIGRSWLFKQHEKAIAVVDKLLNAQGVSK